MIVEGSLTGKRVVTLRTLNFLVSLQMLSESSLQSERLRTKVTLELTSARVLADHVHMKYIFVFVTNPAQLASERIWIGVKINVIQDGVSFKKLLVATHDVSFSSFVLLLKMNDEC